ncbi:MAG: hypothetical protein H6621_00970 [Halobacteriovoraceae bacterium]|nr:hypothetical protein [Halobacteriovoraceae bacterium]MCB9093613.1 hypothetical protein [Halobacteriovoraceae bacterium]
MVSNQIFRRIIVLFFIISIVLSCKENTKKTAFSNHGRALFRNECLAPSGPGPKMLIDDLLEWVVKTLKGDELKKVDKIFGHPSSRPYKNTLGGKKYIDLSKFWKSNALAHEVEENALRLYGNYLSHVNLNSVNPIKKLDTELYSIEIVDEYLWKVTNEDLVAVTLKVKSKSLKNPLLEAFVEKANDADSYFQPIWEFEIQLGSYQLANKAYQLAIKSIPFVGNSSKVKSTVLSVALIAAAQNIAQGSSSTGINYLEGEENTHLDLLLRDIEADDPAAKALFAKIQNLINDMIREESTHSFRKTLEEAQKEASHSKALDAGLFVLELAVSNFAEALLSPQSTGTGAVPPKSNFIWNDASIRTEGIADELAKMYEDEIPSCDVEVSRRNIVSLITDQVVAYTMGSENSMSLSETTLDTNPLSPSQAGSSGCLEMRWDAETNTSQKMGHFQIKERAYDGKSRIGVSTTVHQGYIELSEFTSRGAKCSDTIARIFDRDKSHAKQNKDVAGGFINVCTDGKDSGFVKDCLDEFQRQIVKYENENPGLKFEDKSSTSGSGGSGSGGGGIPGGLPGVDFGDPMQAGIGHGFKAGWYLSGDGQGGLNLVIVPPGTGQGLTYLIPEINELFEGKAGNRIYSRLVKANPQISIDKDFWKKFDPKSCVFKSLNNV